MWVVKVAAWSSEFVEGVIETGGKDKDGAEA